MSLQSRYGMVKCLDITPTETEFIFRGLEYDRQTKLIYYSCGTGPIGKVIMGKIKWFKYKK